MKKIILLSLVLVLMTGCAVTKIGKLERCTYRLAEFDPVAEASEACIDMYEATNTLPRHRNKRSADNKQQKQPVRQASMP